jgi:Mrp family chromosome partitioning ATPase
MDLPEYVAVLRRRWAWGLLPVVVAVAVAALWAGSSPRSYASTEVLFYLSPTPDSIAPEVRLNSYISLATNPQLIDEVRQGLQLTESTTQVARRITAVAKPNSLILTITATGSTPDEARRLALVTSQRLLSVSNTLGVPGTPGSAAIPGVPTTGRTTSGAGITSGAQATSGTGIPTGYLIPVQTAPLGVEQTVMPKTVGLGVVFGLLLGVVLALVREATDGRIRSPDQLARLGLSDHVVVRVPETDERMLPDRIPTGFRLIHAILLRADTLPTSIVVASCRARDRCSSVSAALAVTLARTSAKTLLVATDLGETQRSAPDWALGEPGLGEVLTTGTAPASVIKDSREPGLSLLPSGRPQPVPEDLLTSTAMAEVLADLRSRFDVVLIDAPPLEVPTGALSLVGGSGSAVVLVVVRGWSRRSEVQQTLHLLQAVGSPIAAVALVSMSRRHPLSQGQPSPVLRHTVDTVVQRLPSRP